MSAPEFEFVIVYASKRAGEEARDEAFARTNDRVHALRAGYQARLARSIEMAAWARARRAPQLNMAAAQFFKQNPDVRPRSRAEADQMKAEAEEKYVAERTEIIPNQYVTEIRNGVSARVPARRWHA